MYRLKQAWDFISENRWIIFQFLFLLYLLVLSWMDIRSRKLSLWLLLAGVPVSVISGIFAADIPAVILTAGGAVGILFLIISRSTGEAFGYGDSILILVMGSFSRILEYPLSADCRVSSGSSFFSSNDGSERIYEKISIPFCAVSDSGVSGRNPDRRILNMEERKNVNGSTVVEMAYIIPLFLFFFVILIHTVFYYHDKVILSGAACETAAVSAQEKRRYGTREFDPEVFFTERIRGKLILLTVGEISITENDNETAVEVSAGRSFMKLNICQKAVAAEPEEVIRWVK